MIRIACVSALVLSLAACEESSAPTAGAPGGQPAPATDSPTWLLASMPEGAVGVAEAKPTAAEGERVVLHGRIGGRKDPLSSDSAVFIIMDPEVPSCADMEGDHCATPWDYCCETQESITASNATVQLVGSDGAPLAIDLGKHGFEPLDEVVVVGTVAPRPNEQTLIVKATGVYRTGG
jgi:hypothetical protein